MLRTITHLSFWLVGVHQNHRLPLSDQHGLRVSKPGHMQPVPSQQHHYTCAATSQALRKHNRHTHQFKLEPKSMKLVFSITQWDADVCSLTSLLALTLNMSSTWVKAALNAAPGSFTKSSCWLRTT